MQWNPEQDLTVLLDALTVELLRASDHEVENCHDATTDPLHDAVEVVHCLVAAADADFVVPPLSRFIVFGLRAYNARHQ